MSRTYRCPICVDAALLVYPKEDPNYNIKYDLVSLQNHVATHHIVDLVKFIVQEAEDPDNNYFD